jgi:hypothetical protein
MTIQPHEVSSAVTAERLAAKATARGDRALADAFTARARALQAAAPKGGAGIDWPAIHAKVAAERGQPQPGLADGSLAKQVYADRAKARAEHLPGIVRL